MSDARISEISPTTTDSRIRRALLEGLRALHVHAPHGKGLGQGPTENDAREGRIHAARPLDLAIQRAYACGVPLYGPHGVMQIVDRLRFALREMYGMTNGTASNPQDASEAESEPDSLLDRIQSKRQDQLTVAECLTAAAVAEHQRDALDVYATALRRRAADMESATKLARGRLTGSAA